MDETVGGPPFAVRWGVGVRLRLQLGLSLLSRHDRGCRPYRLPSIRALARSAGVHRNTAAAVYHALERFGLVRCVHGKGTFATLPPDPHRMSGQPLRTADDLTDVLTMELGRELRPRPHPLPRFRREPTGPGALLLPLDATPPAGHRIVPVAPRGAALRAMMRLRPGSNVRLVSRSPSAARLVRHALLALYGNTVGMRRFDRLPKRAPRTTAVARNDARSQKDFDRTSSRVTWDLTLVDAYEGCGIVSGRGTSDRRDAFIPLRMVANMDHVCG